MTKGHLYSPTASYDCLFACTQTAIRLAFILRSYCCTFTIRRSPYFIAYSAYVAATILVRVAAHQQSANVMTALRACLNILQDNEKTNSGVHRANFVLSQLLRATGQEHLRVSPDSERDIHTWVPTMDDSFEIEPANIDPIIESFSMSHPAPNTGGGSGGGGNTNIGTHPSSRLPRSMLHIPPTGTAHTTTTTTTGQDSDSKTASATTTTTYTSPTPNTLIPTPDTLPPSAHLSSHHHHQQQQQQQHQQQQHQQSIAMLDMSVGENFADGDLSTFNDIIFGLHGNFGGGMVVPWPEFDFQ